MNNRMVDDTWLFLNMLFAPDDIIEARIKSHDSQQVSSHYITPDMRERFVSIHLPIHDTRKRHVWVGVGPRENVGNTNPKVNRVLWCDFDDTVKDEEKLRHSLAESGLPHPTILVNSGNGFHAYWKLDEALPPEEARKYSRGVHSKLPTDPTYDPTRVMRLPGTVNYKDPDNPLPCTILEYNEDFVYPKTDFPAVEISIGANAEPRPAKTIPDDLLQMFTSAYIEGVRHHISLGMAGYLRKDRFFNRIEALEALKMVHTGAGYEWPDEGIKKNVNDTYDKPFSQVTGRSVLYEYGVVPPEESVIELFIPERKVPKMSLINFEEEIPEQEFWVQDLVGPGLTTLWAASPKSGKSFCVMQMGYALANGEDLWGLRVPERKKVLYFQGELSRGMVYGRAVGMWGKDNLPSVEWLAMTDKPSETITLNRNPEVLTDLAESYDVIIVDPLSAFNGNDENSYTSVRETLSIFDALKARGKAVVLVHHTRKMEDGVVPSAADARGSGLWISSADSIVMQQKMDDGGATLYFTLRAAPDRDPLRLYRQTNGQFSHRNTEFLERMRSGFSVNVERNI